MSEPKVAEAVAEDTISGICDSLEATLKTSEREIIKREIMSGRLDFDAAKGSFRYRLKVPVQRPNGAITEITLTEPAGGQLREATKGKRDDAESSLHLFSLITGQSLVIVEEIRQRDLGVLAACLGFFG